ncbi:hypothetical protein AS156_05040 [Bradyrhizobium macuxiense]|uniref:HTH luxR-type domain-containing protein n=1 Tax=Bradyrhizobium macuxiense TaxID=1755647 RepID=A0A109JVR0_9BRAD|nr:response regulator transcription factor [Bradyrhizobium macuxiense]KWV55978.1 hypothetical protein AS156_05040 [Bradyrhizobium macuxiense]
MTRQHYFTTVLVGKNSLRREGIAGILRSANFRIQASVSYIDEALSSKAQPRQPMFIILQNADDESDVTVEQIKLCKNRYPNGRIAVVADRYRLSELASAFRAGATGYFVDVMHCDVFIKSIELVMMGETVYPSTFLSFALDPEAERQNEPGSRDGDRATASTEDRLTPQLSPREKSILRCLIEGDSNKCIARKIDIAEATVKVHIKAILRKIRVQNRTQAAIWEMNNRSLTRPANQQNVSLDSGVKQLQDCETEASEIKQIKTVVPLAAIEHRTNRFCADGHMHNDLALKGEPAVRLRKQSAP